jgi:hypothetical protein
MDMVGAVFIAAVLSYFLYFFSNCTRRPDWFPSKVYWPIWSFVAVKWKIPSIKSLVLYNKYMRQRRWDKREDKDKIRIRNFEYNGFMGKTTGGWASFTGEFIRYTNDPGIALYKCSDSKERLIPGWAAEGHLPPQPNYDKMKKQGKMLTFGYASGSEN